MVSTGRYWISFGQGKKSDSTTLAMGGGNQSIILKDDSHDRFGGFFLWRIVLYNRAGRKPVGGESDFRGLTWGKCFPVVIPRDSGRTKKKTLIECYLKETPMEKKRERRTKRKGPNNRVSPQALGGEAARQKQH